MQRTSTQKTAAPTLAITGEAAAYIFIAAAAVLLRLLLLGALPLSDAESEHALAALRAADSGAPGPASPALCAGQALTFGLFGAGGLAARLPAALAGVALALMPALWRKRLGTLTAQHPHHPLR